MAFPKGQSGNPKGRPPGTTLAGRLRTAVGAEYDAILGAVIQAAKGGDMTAASLLLSRVAPTLKPIQEAVRLNLEGETLSQKAAGVVEAVSAGKLTPSDGKAILDGLAAVAKINEIDELTRRLEALESWAGKQK